MKLKDFTLQKYQEFCSFLLIRQYSVITVYQFLKLRQDNQLPQKFVVLRHDVDRWLDNAIQMARNENKNNIISTYYFRYPATFNVNSIRTISELGHEIGYHYEVLSKNDGNEKAAIEDFKSELNYFNRICPIRTISMHGNPLSRHDNRDLWKKNDYRDYGIIGEAYLSMSDLEYFSDTGRTWSGGLSKFDFLSGITNKSDLHSTDNLMLWISKTCPSGLYLTVHPERWAGNRLQYIISWSMDLFVNIGKITFLMRF